MVRFNLKRDDYMMVCSTKKLRHKSRAKIGTKVILVDILDNGQLSGKFREFVVKECR